MPKHTEVQHKKERFYTKKKFYIISTVILVGIISAYAYFTREQKTEYDYVVAEKGKLMQEVSVTGSVQPIESVDLTFEVSGRVEAVYVQVGDYVEAGQELVSLESSSIDAQFRQALAAASSAQAQLAQYEAALESVEAQLAEMEKGTRPEEITIAQTTVTNAENSLKNAETNLVNVQAQAEVNLRDDYNSALTALLSAVNTGKNALLTLSDIQHSYFSSSSISDINLANAKKEAVSLLLGASNAGSYSTESISTLNGGVFGRVQSLVTGWTEEEVDQALTDTIAALQKVNNALNTVPITADLSATEKAGINTAKTSISTEITTLTGKQQAIAVQKVTNSSAVSAAESEINSAENVLASAEDQLALKEAGYTYEQIASQKAKVRQAEANVSSQRASISQAWANVSNYQAQIEKTILTAPIAGLVTKVEAEVGEVMFPSSTTYEVQMPVVSIIGEGNFEMEVNVPEVDISNVKVGDIAIITLDAYGSDMEFEATVTEVDPAETLIEGIPTYKVTLQFTESDEQIKSGMTANIDIMTDMREDVIAIPQRAVITQNDAKFVRILQESDGMEELAEVEVTTGLRGSDGRIEITEGVNEGDKVVIFVKDNN
ncbi:efflux RND transporter periplasmic adaptor subunit [Patescibacteria group bacterium]|nr:efflux RND transporter periplasmic adaptor subunit [Patescibacteria group bacterium]